MKVTRLLLWTGSVAAVAALAVEPPSLSIQNSTNGAVVNVESPGVTPVVGTAYHLRFESRTDLRAWRDEGRRRLGHARAGRRRRHSTVCPP